MSYIFISYSHEDKGYAHRLEEALKQRGFEVWLDDRIDYGSQWPKTIEEKLDGCKAMILIMTSQERLSGIRTMASPAAAAWRCFAHPVLSTDLPGGDR